MTRRFDPHLDPLRAPTAAGQHPHTVNRSMSMRNPQSMYEYRDNLGAYHEHQRLAQARAAMALQQQQAQMQQQAHSGGGLSPGLFMLGLGALAAWALVRMTQLEKGDGIRSNPSSPTGQPVVVIPPATGPAITVAPAQTLDGEIISSRVKEPPKEKRKRRTTQARDPKTGTYKRAGTRKRPVTEGKKS